MEAQTSPSKLDVAAQTQKGSAGRRKNQGHDYLDALGYAFTSFHQPNLLMAEKDATMAAYCDCHWK